jgi:hypothetical protein
MSQGDSAFWKFSAVTVTADAALIDSRLVVVISVAAPICLTLGTTTFIFISSPDVDLTH